MTKTKRALAALLAIVLLVALLATSAFAADNYRETGKITLGKNYDGKTYDFYRILGMEVNSTTGAYRYVLLGNDWDTFINSNPTYFTITDGKYVTPEFASNSTEAAAVAKLAAAYAEGKDSLKAYTVAGTGTADLPVASDAPVGYYLMRRSATALASLGSVLPTRSSAEAYNLAIYDKNEAGVTTKTFIDGYGGEVIGNPSYDVGDTMYFRISAIVSKDGVTQVYMTDTMTGLTGLTGVKVYFSAVADGYANKLEVPSTNVTVTETITGKEYVIGIYVPAGWEKFAKDDKIIVEYQATVTEEAVAGGELKNVVTSDDFAPGSGNITPGVGDPIYGVDLVKTDEDNNVISGAAFKLYDAESGGNEIKVVAVKGYTVVTTVVTDPSQIDYYRPASSKEIEQGLAQEYILAGFTRINDLTENTTYYLEEITAPDGYIKVSGRTTVYIGYESNFAIVVDGKYYYKGVQVINTAGTELPSTGGVGTTIFYVAGLVLVLCAAAVLVSKKRTNV